MQKKITKNELKQIQESLEISAARENINRARSVSVGTAFGGTTEITMRGNGEKFLFALLQPVEVVELVHQLSANIGCHLALKPRDDFSSWREWRISEAEKEHLGGFPPFVNDMAVFQRLGTTNFNQQQAEQIMKEHLAKKKSVNRKGLKNGTTVATEKNIDRRSSKQSAKAA